MDEWAAYCGGANKAGDVVQLRRAWHETQERLVHSSKRISPICPPGTAEPDPLGACAMNRTAAADFSVIPVRGCFILCATAEIAICTFNSLLSHSRCSSAFEPASRASPDIDRVERVIREINHAGFRANEVLEGDRALVRNDAQEQRPFNMNELVSEVLQSFRGEIRDHNVMVYTELPSELPIVNGHRSQVQEVITNLVRNAIEGRDAIVVGVQDSGPGIGAKRLDDIFGAFITTKAHGTGLGLAICRMIIERHGGTLTASSDGISGALFQFVLPIGPTDDSAARASNPS
jgi:signal transduction histidine kinase